MNINVNVVGQKLNVSSDLKHLVSGTQEFICFTFKLPPDWADLICTAQFTQNDHSYDVKLNTSNQAYLPPVIEPGTCTMMLYGSNGNVIATSNFVQFTIDQSRKVINSETYDLTQGLYEQFCEYVDRKFKEIVDLDDEDVQQLISDQVAAMITEYLNSDEFIQRTISIPENSITNEKIANATISRNKVDSDFEATLDKADTAMQPSVYDTHNKSQDIFDYVDTAANGLSTSLGNVIAEISDAYNIPDDETPVVYDTLGNAVRGALASARRYTQSQISSYVPYTVVVVDELPEIGADRTFYLVAKEFGEGYDKYWYVTNELGDKVWDNFGSSSTVVVEDELPEVGDADVDYILHTNGEYQYFKYIDGEWQMIAGGGGEVITANNDGSIIKFGEGNPTLNGLNVEDFIVDSQIKKYLDVATFNVWEPTVEQPNDGGQPGENDQSENPSQDEPTEPSDETPTYVWGNSGSLVETPSENKDYFIKDETGSWCHFRYIGNRFSQIGSSAYTRDEMDAIINGINTNISDANTRINAINNATDGFDTRLGDTERSLLSLSNTVGNIQQAISEIDTDGYTYYATYGTAEIGGAKTENVYALHQVKDSTDEIVSQFVITGGGGGGQTAITNLVVDKVTNSPLVLTVNDPVIIEIDYSSTDDDGETYDATYTWKLDNRIITTGQIVNQGRISFDLTEYCGVGTQKLSLTVTDEAGSIALKSWTVQKVDVRIESNFSDRNTVEIGKPVQFTYTPYGAVNKTIHFKLDGVETTYTTSASGTLQSYTVPAQSHGSHLLDVWVTAVINNVEIETNHIYRDIIWYDGSIGNNPVIGCIYRNDYYGKVSVRQYDTLPITYNVFDPATNFPTVKRYVDDVLVGTDTISTSQNTWNFQSDEVGDHTLRIEVRDTVVTIVVEVTELGIDVSPITGGLEIDFNPTGITNSSSDRIWHNDNYHMEVSENFDWANGGYRTDENGDSYFLIKAGTNVSFDYLMFDGGIENNPSVLGSEMKVIFMTENVQDANAVWLTNVETTTTEAVVDGQTVTTTTNMGIQMGVHNGWLKTNKASDIAQENGDDTVAATNTYLYMPYSEEDIIEMDINIDTIDTEDETAQAFVMSYEDGVPSKAYVYDNSDRFYQFTPQPLVIGSTYCDVRIYRLKIYSTSLTTDGIMRNFIADSRNSTTMLSRYDRNSIYYNRETNSYTPYSGEGILDPERLAPIIPNVKVLMLETDHFTTSKKTFVKSNLRCIHAPGGTTYAGDPYYDNWYFENGWHSGQGTTSDNYGNSGRNVDFLFNCDGVHKPSDKIKDPEADYISRVTLGYHTENAYTEEVDDWKGTKGKISLTRTSVPNNFYNLKVNIASSENANNAMMQKRFSDFLPYISPAKKRDSKIKNDMEFVPAVLFLKETNPDISTHNEFQDTEWHFYALGNLGDSKKTDYTRAYNPTDMNEFTIEISDNTKNNATFQTGVYQNQDGTYGYEHFHLVKTLDKEGELVVTAVSETPISTHVYPVPSDQIDELLFQKGTITVINNTGLSEHDGDEYGYLNMRMWCLYNEGFDGDHSFEPRYACCGDYRDGKLVNDYSGYGKQQVKTDEKVWRAFYKWVITSTNEQFVQELDQWCVRSAVEFFYAFTLYYTMMDNRAKNTFWHFAKTGVFREVSRPVEELLHVYCELVDNEYVPTEDTEIDPEKTYYTEYAFDQWGYDMDTGLGINNNGELVFPYGKEDTDYNIDNTPSSGWVFNGATSAFWCRLRDLLSSEISETFNSVTAECFSATNLVNQFDKFQECFPEEVWRLDIERKYIRTYTGKSLDNSIPKHDMHYLRDMMQGRKKYQRRQWVRDQEIYYGTKYLMNNVVGDNNRITFRCYDPGTDVVVAPNYSLSITPFQDMYVSAMFGNGDQRQVRAKAGQAVTLNFAVDTATDTQVTIYGANRIAALNDLSACYVATIDFAMATKLRKLVLGNPTEGYINSRLTALSVGTNRLLEELDIRNCINLTGAVNLSQCSNLLKFYGEGTRITNVSFATNGKVQVIHLPPTINTLSMRNLNNLVDFQGNLDYITTLTLQGGVLDNLEIVNDTIDTLNVAYLYDLDWTLADSSLLTRLLNIYYSQLTGEVYVNGSIRIREISAYENKWPDLEVTYNPEYLVEQYPATYVNEDNTELFVTYVDRGSTPPDPVANGDISTPTKASTPQYDYIFSGWSDIVTAMTAPRTIVAQYTEQIRTYTVTWYARAGVPLQTTQAQYGAEVVYTGDYPTRTDGESTMQYYIFLGWDKSTGYITGNTDVYATWDSKPLPAPRSKELHEMSVAEIYGIAQAANLDTSPINVGNYIDEKDYVDIRMGNDFNFSNIESRVICQDKWFDGTEANCVNTGIKLFDSDSPSFTLAIDFEYVGTANGSTLISCYDDSTDGFRLRYSSNPQIEWGGTPNQVGAITRRGICVLRHQAGSRRLFIYGYNLDQQSYQDNITVYEAVAQRDMVTDKPIILGGTMRVRSDGISYENLATGWIHWCKIWYQDLGNANAMELAAWPHETWRVEYYSGGTRYHIDNSIKYAKLPFIMNHQLSMLHQVTSNTSGGWPNYSIRDPFLSTRVFNAMPIGWRMIIKPLEIMSSNGDDTQTIVTSHGDKFFVPSLSEITGSTQEPYLNEGSLISWFDSYLQRIKFLGKTIPEGATMYRTATDPTQSSGNTVKAGDIWVRTDNNTIGYIYIPQEVASKHALYIFDSYNVSIMTAADGGTWYPANGWWTRSPYYMANQNNYMNAISNNGNSTVTYVGSSYGLVLCFAV